MWAFQNFSYPLRRKLDQRSSLTSSIVRPAKELGVTRPHPAGSSKSGWLGKTFGNLVKEMPVKPRVVLEMATGTGETGIACQRIQAGVMFPLRTKRLEKGVSCCPARREKNPEGTQRWPIVWYHKDSTCIDGVSSGVDIELRGLVASTRV